MLLTSLRSRCLSGTTEEVLKWLNVYIFKCGHNTYRKGRERSVIFNEERFPKPYLELRKDTAVVDLSLSLPENDEHLKKAFENPYHESTSRDILSSNGQTKTCTVTKSLSG